MPTKRFENLSPERRDHILDAAEGEFIRSGYEGASLQAIAGEAGISKGSLYYYFEDKVDLYLSTFDRRFCRLQDEIGGIAKGEYSDDFWRDVEEYTREVMLYIRDHPHLTELWKGLLVLYAGDHRDDRVLDYITQSKRLMEDIVRHGLDSGAFTTDLPFDLLVSVLFSAGEALDTWLLENIDTFSAADYIHYHELYIKLWKRIVILPEEEA